MEEWLQCLLQKDKRTIAKIITQIENGSSDKLKRLEEIFPHTGQAFLIGITGPPGAGKSSLMDRMIQLLRQEGCSVGVIAVDPTSPFTGGAILGDRVRMTKHALDPHVFIRSMGSRGSLGGLSRAAKEAVRVLDAAGFDVIFIETVGVGQAELDIMHLADTVALVMTPGTGDVVQVFKAGIMEIADIFVVNKADRSGAARLVAEINELLDLVKHEAVWRPPVIQTIVPENKGIVSLWEGIQRHKQYLQDSGEWVKRRENHLRQEVWEVMEDILRQRLLKEITGQVFQQELEEVAQRRMVPHRLAQKWVARVLPDAKKR
jgi:LAO/AO transport system kinase